MKENRHGRKNGAGGKALLRWGLSFLLCAVFFLGNACRTRASGGFAPETIRVGYTPNGQMVHEEPDGSFTGYGVEYLERVAAYTGWNYAFVPVEEETRRQDLQNGTIDLLCDISEEEAQDTGLVLSQDSISLVFGVLCAKETDDTVFFNDYEGMNGKRVAVNVSKNMSQLLAHFAADHQISFQVVECPDYEAALGALESGEADLVLTTNQRNTEGLKYVAKVGVQNQHFAMAQGNSARMERIDYANRQLLLESPFMVSALYDKYYGRPSELLTGITREEHDFMASGEFIRVACCTGEYPVCYRDAQTGECRGIFVDIMDLIAERSGLHFRYVPVSDFSRAPELLAQGEVDMIAGLYMSAGQASSYQMRLSDSYWKAGYTVIGRSDTGLLEHPTVAVAKNHIGAYRYLEGNKPDWTLLPCETIPDCLDAVEQGRADAMILNTVFLQTVYNLDSYRDLAILPGEDLTIPLCSGIGGSQPQTLQSILNKTIHKIPAKDLERCVVENSIHIAQEPSARDILRKAAPLLAGIVLLLVAGLMLFIKLSERRFRYLAMTDLVTGLGNGIAFRQDAHTMLERGKQKEFCILSLDMERFKYVNNDFGEKSADTVLQIMGKRLVQQFGKDALYARDMADMFLVMTEYREDIEERLQCLSEEIVFAGGGMEQRYRPILKCGICRIPARKAASGQDAPQECGVESGCSPAEYIDAAVMARKSIKGLAGKSVAYYNKEMAEEVLNERKIEKRMETALLQNEFVVYYQPKYHLKSEKIIGAEALVRWQDPEEGLIPPGRFIPIFERNGFVVRLDFYVYEEVCRALAKWRQEGRRPIVVSVNVSRVHIGTTDFLQKLVALADRYGVPHSLLELELTETVLGGKRQEILDFISSCKQAGFQISIDDFGSGYSSLNLLKELPVDVLKIDREFLNETAESEKSSIIVEQVVEMATRISIRTLCEGVETKNQAEFLRQIGCDMAQGYLYSRPVPIREFEAMLKEESA